MSVPQLERNFVNALIRRCDRVFFNRIESMTSVGFPDLVMIYGSQIKVVEAKVVHAGDWIYIRNTQMAWCHKAANKGLDAPFILGMAGSGIGFFRFSALTGVMGQRYKNTHVRYKVHEVPHIRTGKYDDWQMFLISCLFT
jgi:Holliday junction resolvase